MAISAVEQFLRRLTWFSIAGFRLAAVLALASLAHRATAQTLPQQTPPQQDVPKTPPRVAQARHFLALRGWPAHQSQRILTVPSAASMSNAQSTAASTAVWQPLGPTAVMTPNYGLVTGRVSSIAIDPADVTGNHVYLGTTGGGVWSSQNAASSGNVVFTPLTDSGSVFDSLRYGSISIGAVTVQPGGTGVVLAGTGDPNDALDSYYGSGLLRSTDGGHTWTATTFTTDYQYSFLGEGFAGFAWSTVNPQLVVAAVAQSYEGTLVSAPFQNKSYAGLYYSTDAGATWSLARITDGPGKDVQGPLLAFAQPYGNSATAVVWNPVRRLFIAAVRFHGYYQSSDAVTWTRMATQPGSALTSQMCPTNLGSTGSIACPIFRGVLAVNPSSGDTFAWTVDLYNQDQGLWQDACAIAGGACANDSVAFTKPWSTAPLHSNSILGPATVANGDYNLVLAAVPSAQDTILLAGANDLWRCSLAMGCSWRNTTNAYTCASSHVAPYQHALAWNSANAQEILIGNDSGLWRSMDAIAETGSVCSSDDAGHFQNLNQGLGSVAEVQSLSQIYTSPYTLMAGLGVNGAAGVRSTSGPTAIWPQILGGEGGAVAIDPMSPNNWYVNASAGVSIHRCSQSESCTPDAFGTAPTVDNADVAGDGYTMTSPAPFIIDPLDPSQILLGTCRLWRGPADGTPWTTANAVSPFFDHIAGHTYCSGDALVRSIAAMPVAGGGEVIYVGMFGSLSGGAIIGGHVFKATLDPNSSAAPNWTDLTFNPVANAQLSFNYYGLDISSIYIDPHDLTGNTAYIAIAGMPDFYHAICTVYRTIDGGLHWYQTCSNIRSPANDVVVDPEDASTVYVATDAGVYSTRQIATCVNGPSNCWSVFGTGLPYAPVTRLSAAQGAAIPGVLVAGTYGRGVWQVPLWSSGIQLTTASVDPNSLTFPSQAVGSASPAQSLTLKNEGGIGLTVTSISAAAPFSESDDCLNRLINEGSSCSIEVVFDPDQVGPASSVLTIAGNLSDGPVTVPLAGTGSAADLVNVFPGTLDFGQVAIGKRSDFLPVTLENASSAAVSISSVSSTGPFSIATNPCGASLAANSACALSVVFTPTEAGAAAGILTVIDSAGTQTVYLKGSGATAAGDTLSTSSLVFTSTPVGQQSDPEIVRLSNTGDLPLESISENVSAGFRSTDTCHGSLGAHASCAITVVFAPESPGDVVGTLVVSDALRSQSIRLSGTGLEAPAIKVSPAQVAFPALGLGQTSSPVTFTISNTGGAAIANLGFQITGASASSFSWNASTCGAILQSGDSCTIQISFAPALIGQLTATLVVSSSTAGTNPVQAPLSGIGQTTSGISISPPQINLTQAKLGEPSAPQLATISNVGKVIASELVLTASAPFGLTQNTCGSSLAPAASCSVGVVFTPAANGVVNGTLAISSTTFAGPTNAALVGIGGAAGSVQAQPGSLAFPSTGVGLTATSKALTLTNNGLLALTNLNLATSAAFAIASTTCGSSLDPGAACTLQIAFAPLTAGEQTGTLTAASGALAVPLQTPLSGIGFDFTLGISGQSSKTVSSGQTATYTLALTPLNGSTGTFTFSCSSLPPSSACTINPASQSVPANGSGSFTVSIATGTSSSTASLLDSWHKRPFHLLPVICLALPLALARRRRRRLLVGMAAVALIGITSCAGAGGGGGGAPVSPNGNTPAGTYSVVISARASGVSHTATITLIVD